jgi:hypothetical protein
MSNFMAFACRTFRPVRPNLLRTVLAGLLLVQVHSASAALSFGRGIPTMVGGVRFASSPDSVTITGALTGPGTVTSGLAIPANRIQYDVISSDQGNMSSWTVYYSPLVGASIIGAFTPLGYVTSGGAIVPEGGFAYTTLFNAGYGVYNYNTGAPWSIDYEPDHITFTGTASPLAGLPMNDGAGYLNPTPYLPSFAVLFSPDLGNGLVPASAKIGTASFGGQVYGPLPGNPCLSIQCTNLIVETCSNCVPVTFSAAALDTCCSNAVLQYNPPSGTCFPQNSSTTVQVTALDQCGNAATNYFTVTVSPGPNCLPTNCISISASNIVAYTCNPCTPVLFNATATDYCCSGGGGVTLVFNPPPTTCFPQNSATTVQVTALDQCGNTATNYFTVTVLPGPTCGPTNCISILSSNIVVSTCSNCTTVPFTAKAIDFCCSNVFLVYNPPTNTCFPVNTKTPVQIMAFDYCGNTVTNYITVTVNPGPNCLPTNCISINAPDIVVYTCSNCTPVLFNATATDRCCSISGVTLVYNPAETTCFPLNSTTPIQVTGYDQCGNVATNSFKVTVLPASNCGPTNCISIYCSNIVAYTCSNCTFVPFSAYAVDTCCPAAGGPTLTFNPPETTCFPVNTTTLVLVTAYDQCGDLATNSFTVTILPGANCGGSIPDLSIAGSLGSATNFIISWTATNAQLQQSSDLIHWLPIPGATNSPYVAPNLSPRSFYRLRYN